MMKGAVLGDEKGAFMLQSKLNTKAWVLRHFCELSLF